MKRSNSSRVKAWISGKITLPAAFLLTTCHEWKLSRNNWVKYLFAARMEHFLGNGDWKSLIQREATPVHSIYIFHTAILCSRLFQRWQRLFQWFQCSSDVFEFVVEVFCLLDASKQLKIHFISTSAWGKSGTIKINLFSYLFMVFKFRSLLRSSLDSMNFFSSPFYEKQQK